MVIVERNKSRMRRGQDMINVLIFLCEIFNECPRFKILPLNSFFKKLIPYPEVSLLVHINFRFPEKRQ